MQYMEKSTMTNHVAEQPWLLCTQHTTDPTRENREGLIVTIVMLSAPATAEMTPGHHTSPSGPVTDADSFENATWEDAEWQ
jgi:hypothetical protein